ncbi:VOC family protein [Portibacter lacus]|uniref:VOC domain-containing protein n=1 Tax=Portibacter lacus TaxID=1099794 RepID=A0AA37SSQ6_9BACT|nr:VOC family protein [Portibacter lacus]GLR17493.1 hypothetical protein GCM10007940_21080 [Portibacter lacus]
MVDFKIDFLDHVAIRVKDIDLSAKWYTKVLGLKECKFKEWGAFPVFMLAGKTGIALFPANGKDTSQNANSRNIKIDHFAFNVSSDSFQKAKEHLNLLGIEFQEQDHHYFRSIYFEDPDGHSVELTNLVVPDYEFYK